MDQLSTKGNSLPGRSITRTGLWILTFFCIFLALLCISMFLGNMVSKICGPNSLDSIYISSVIQNLVAFAATSFITVRCFSSDPIEFTGLKTGTTFRALAGIIIIYILTSPMINQIALWNQEFHLPDSMTGLENSLRGMEESAAAITKKMLDNPSMLNMVIAVLVVGILTGICEELLFRGCLQRILSRSLSHHASIWISAFIFSAIHFQFFGFIPRLLLGAWFGYLLWWTGSIWTSIFAHSLNNSIVVIIFWLQARNIAVDNFNTIGTSDNGIPWVAILSFICFIMTIILFRKSLFSPIKNSDY